LAVLGLAYPFFANAVPEKLVSGIALATMVAIVALGIWRVCSGAA